MSVAPTTPSSRPAAPAAYVLGHADLELERLERQGQFLRGLTHDVLVRAGIGPGMRVLDFGAGAGDVSLALAQLVGPTGRVIAVDRADEAAARAVARFAALGVERVDVHIGDEDTALALAGAGYDAVVGRLVLLHQRDPEATLTRLLAGLRPGGVAVFHEIEIDAGCWASPALPLLARAFGWITDAFAHGGMPGDISARLAGRFDRAGLRDVRIMREGRIEAGPTSGAYEFMARTVRTLFPLIERLGLATAADVDIDTLEARLRDEAVTAGARFIPAHFTAAWARR